MIRLLLFVFSVLSAALALPLEKVILPPGFEIEVYVDGVPDARQMAMGKKGTLFVGTREAGRIYAVRDTEGDRRPDTVEVIAEGLFMPSGIAFKDGSLYVAEVDRILRYDEVETSLPDVGEAQVVFDALPNKRRHGWRHIAFGPDGRLYISIGVPCNVCNPPPPFGTIISLDLTSKEVTLVARGVRNSVGFDWHPDTHEFWFTDNGRDLLGDDVPDDELNRVTAPAQHFGFPFFHGKDTPDPVFGRRKDPDDYRRPAAGLGAHVAALGMHFYHGRMFPKTYKNAIFIAEHGSWNRSEKVGYRVNVIRLEGSSVVSDRPFATGKSSGAARSRCWNSKTAHCSSPTITPASSTASATPETRTRSSRPTRPSFDNGT
jgi:glucose/arabinose dehydrogenase